ncbi:MAG: DinB family protein [Planctomycetes bacterium]|nr:DinB family protein [Planctomycetota bacterium]NUQ35516.1 DinB family protein [Planctomycetaceae bacterium]
MTWSDLLKAEIESTYNATRGLFQLCEGNKLDWKPATGKNWMTLGQVLMHCTNACGFCCKGFVTGDWGPMPGGNDAEAMLPPAEKLPTIKSVAEAIKLLDLDKDMALKSIAEATEKRLESERSTPPWGGPEYTLGQHLLHMIGHLAIHRAQLYYYLKLMGKDVNTHHMWGMV